MPSLYISHDTNQKYCGGKFATWTKAFCRVNRKITQTPDPGGVYDFWGECKLPTARVYVYSTDGIEWDVWGPVAGSR